MIHLYIRNGKDRDKSMSVAESFVEKLYNDDNFLVSVIKASGINDVPKGHKTTETETNDMMAKAARELGYEISTEEYAAALKAQTQKVGAWKAIKFLIRLTRLAKKAEKGKV